MCLAVQVHLYSRVHLKTSSNGSCELPTSWAKGLWRDGCLVAIAHNVCCLSAHNTILSRLFGSLILLCRRREKMTASQQPCSWRRPEERTSCNFDHLRDQTASGMG
ncbi:hypothetical protein AMELA_G00006400 [Ameiurus melas]|uniref:Uncharacterized protein n=1 Tax=Ameiurus melas TaxID=219545 RepID=A0A7J6BGT1_AMEME|nr:hypothetical protein AMELA_G00006400 [Ameiurus melas]